MLSFCCDKLAQHLYALLSSGKELQLEQFQEAVIKVLLSLGLRDCLHIAGGLTKRFHQALCFQAFKLHPNSKVRPVQVQLPQVNMRLYLLVDKFHVVADWLSSVDWALPVPVS